MELSCLNFFDRRSTEEQQALRTVQTFSLYNYHMDTALTTNTALCLKLIELFAEGYTARYIVQHIKEQFEVELSDAQVLQAAVQFEADIAHYQEELGQKVMKRGLARKEERIRRLARIAERLEPKEDENMNLKQVKEYRATLKQIGDEVSPLGLTVPIDESDQWLVLLSKLKPSTPQDLIEKESTPSLPSSASSLQTSSNQS